MNKPKPARTKSVRTGAAQKPSEKQAGEERRGFRRVKLDLPGRLYLPAQGCEAQCVIVDMSPGGAALLSDVGPEIGASVILYLDGFGRFEGRVVRHDQGGFGLAFASSPSKRRRTAEQLILFLNEALGYDELLDMSVQPGRRAFAKFTRADGQVVQGELTDISLHGVSLKTDVKPPVGEFVLIARIAGRIVCHHADGVGIDFVGNENAA
jgi:hypothetical protein